ncbi:hypothetical protein [Stenotrophomonas pavanii]|uniref:hypothetical protein n=1 Tax=Stenotrophomonas pavanii TaxID=487698 RepID=UPI0011301C49|nr:hypothetical protein [Stenotrophomonas pavanii]
MSGLQQLWNGISPCMEPGVADCVVWWDAWAVVVAILGVVVATVSVGVAALAAFAVFVLGQKANEVAQVGLTNGLEERRRLNAESQAERQREEQVLLCFLSGELAHIRVRVGAMLRLLNGAVFSRDQFVSTPDIRARLEAKAGEITMNKLSSVISRLHAVQPKTGMRLARLAGDISSIQREVRVYAGIHWEPDKDDDPGLAKEKIEGLGTGFDSIKRLVVRAAGDAVMLDDRAVEETALLRTE